MNTSNKIIPVQADERIQVIDVLRGFAIFGILLMNMRSFSGQAFSPTSWHEPLDRYILILIDMFAQAKFYSLFSFLFGWGMAMQMERAQAKGIKFIPFYLRRLVILFIFGGLHSIFLWTGDILTMYSLLGMLLLLLFSRRSGRVLLIAFGLSLLSALVMTLPGQTMDGVRLWCQSTVECLRPDNLLPQSLYVTGSYLEVTQLRFQEYLGGFWWVPCYFGSVFAMMLLGLYVGKQKIFENIQAHLPIIRKALWIGLAIGLPLNGLFVYSTLHPFATEYLSLIRVGARTIGAPALTVFYMTVIILFFQTGKGRQRLAPLSHVGRMALSNYISHSIVAPLIFYGYGLGLYGETDPTFGLILTVVIYLSQIRLSQWWFEHYQYGPLEWLWRTLSYGLQHPFSVMSSYESIKNLTPQARKRRTFGIVTVSLLFVVGMALLTDKLIQKPANESLLETPQSEITGTNNGQSPSTTDTVEPVPVATPVVEPVHVIPGPIAASGDLMSLAGTFNAELAYEQVKTLADESYMGRFAGSVGGQTAGDYIAKQFARFGLQPVGNEGSFFQEFPVPAFQLTKMPRLSVTDSKGVLHDTYQAYQDFKPLIGQYAGAGRREGDLIWVVDCTPKYFHGLNVVGKVILCRDEDSQRASRLAVENGAAGLLLLADPSTQPPGYREAPLPAWIPEPIPVFYVYPNVEQELLDGVGYSVSDLSILYEPIELKVRIRMEMSIEGICGDDLCVGRNILGVLPGTDPLYADQVMIVSANYDHVGGTPDGKVWPGANSNASGIAVMLEIARGWQEQSYVPKVTTLFAAWDAGEQDSLGARYYVQNPKYPLEGTVAVLNLDEVGTGGGSIEVNGNGLTNQVEANAQLLGIETTVTDDLKGDHRPFVDANVSTASLAWNDEERFSHTPADTPETIQLENLNQAGQLVELMLLGMSDGRTNIDELLVRRATAVRNGDLQAFLDTSTLRQRQNDGRWFQAVQSSAPASFEITKSSLVVDGNTAHGSVRLQLGLTGNDESGSKTIAAELPVAFVHTASGWQWDGADLLSTDTVSVGMTRFTIHYPAGAVVDDQVTGEPVSMEDIGQQAANEYIRITNALSLSSDVDAHFYLYSKAEHLRADTSLLSSGNQSEWIAGNTIKTTFTRDIGEGKYLHWLLSRLAIGNAGVPHDSFVWLWDGLPLVLNGKDDQVGVQMKMLASLKPELSRDDDGSLSPEASWAAVEYLRQKLGWDGLGRFITNIGRFCQINTCTTEQGEDQALMAAINLDTKSFNGAWRQYWLTKLDSAQADLDRTLANRVNAVLNRDETLFLQTVDMEIPNLFAEERDWFADLSRYPAEIFALSANPLAFLEDGSILASVKMEFQLVNASTLWGWGNLPLVIRFTPSSNGYLWSGPLMQTITEGRIRIRFPEGREELAQALLGDADKFYSQLATEMRASNLQRLTINLYEDKQSYRSSIALSFPAPEWAPGWSSNGHSIKLPIMQADSSTEYQGALVEHISRQILRQKGIEKEWLLAGASSYLSRNVAGGILQRRAAAQLTSLNRVLGKDGEFNLAEFPPLYLLSEDEYKVASAQAWDTIRFIAEEYGQDVLFNLLSLQRNSVDLDISLRSATGLTIPEFVSAWKDSLINGNLSQSQIESALAFDERQAEKHIEYLTSNDLAGRQAGSMGSGLSAVYIADNFSSSGLVVEEQAFPVRFQKYLAVPTMDLIYGNEGRKESFVFRTDFLVLQPVDTAGILSGELVWVADEKYTNMALDGKVVVRYPSLSIQDEIKIAQEHGAGALILIGNKQRTESLKSKYPLPPSIGDDAIPVYEFTPQSFNRLLELTGQDQNNLLNGPPAIFLNTSIQLQVDLSEPEMVETANIIGLLPGSNPDLREEYIILGAHYDHVGDEAGTPYRGANDNASGIAVLLETARLWQASGYHPQRSVLFVAWGAQEPGNLGSQYFMENPPYPLENIIASIQLDAIGGGDGYYLEALGTRTDDGLLLFNIQKAADLTESRLHITLPDEVIELKPDELFSPDFLFKNSSMIYRSDDNTTRRMGIPTVLLRWLKSDETNLPNEFADEVLPERLATVGEIISAALMMLAR